jgi:circadian clock protein KaiC
MAHSNQVREFVLTSKGIALVDIYCSPAGAFMGSARLNQMAADEAVNVDRRERLASKERALKEKRSALEARVAALRAESEAEIRQIELNIAEEKAREKALAAGRSSLASHRENGR